MTRNLVIAAIVVAVGFAIARGEVRKAKPFLSKVPLTAEQMAVYKAFLTAERPFPDERGSVNLDSTTVPLDLSDELPKKNECLTGIDFENLNAAERIVHAFGPKITQGQKLKLVNRTQVKSIQRRITNGEQGFLLELSEIAFDKTHQFAVLEYSFSCGNICGHGATRVLQKLGKEWKDTKRPCPSWIS